jgi:hypothetical protein
MAFESRADIERRNEQRKKNRLKRASKKPNLDDGKNKRFA